MNSFEDKNLLAPYLVYQAINEKFNNEFRKTKDEKNKLVIQMTHLVILGDFVERYLGVESEAFLNDVRDEIAEKSGTDVKDVRVAELNLYFYKLGTIFRNSIPLLQEMEMVD